MGVYVYDRLGCVVSYGLCLDELMRLLGKSQVSPKSHFLYQTRHVFVILNFPRHGFGYFRAIRRRVAEDAI